MIAMCLGMLTVRLCLLRSSNARIVDLFLIGVTFAQARWLGVMRVEIDAIATSINMMPLIDPAITFVHKCSNVSDLLTKDCEPATKQAILSMVKAPPTTIGMGRPVALTGLEILWRLHVVFCIVGHRDYSPIGCRQRLHTLLSVRVQGGERHQE